MAKVAGFKLGPANSFSSKCQPCPPNFASWAECGALCTAPDHSQNVALGRKWKLVRIYSHGHADRRRRAGICCSGISGEGGDAGRDVSGMTIDLQAQAAVVERTEVDGNRSTPVQGTIWKHVKELTTAVMLSALISFPVGGDFNLVFAAESGYVVSTEDAPSSSPWALSSSPDSAPSTSTAVVLTELDDPQCAASGLVTGRDENQNNQAEEVVTNESVVAEAWQVVNEFFLDARRHVWSAGDWAKIKEENLKRPYRSKMAAYGAIRGMLATLNDPYTRFLTPDQFRELAKYDVTGVGLNIGEVENGKGKTSLAVLGIVLGSPAHMMGIRQGDELLAVDGTSVVGMSAFEAASLIQGPKGTPVSIQIKHGPCDIVKNLTVARQQDVRTPVYYRLEHTQNKSEHIGYIRLREFNALAKRDLVIAMKRLREAGATSFLLDLQDNPGGLVQVIRTAGRIPENVKSITATGVPFTKAPLMVLVNDRTASASEIVAAALHDNCRAILVGNRTFGKGLIQSVFELSDGSGLILTVGKYVTPGKIDIDGNGIEPDFRSLPGLSEAEEKLRSCTLQLRGSDVTN